MKSKLKSVVFLVGCSRSGTTLLQSLLAAHPEIKSFPESNFFDYLIPSYEPKRYAFGLISRRLKPRLERFFIKEIKRPELFNKITNMLPFISLYSRRFIDIMKGLTLESGKSVWLEKTPEHIYYINYIKKVTPEVKFIHLLRRGTDVVASLYEVTHKYPKSWGGPWDIDTCINQWLNSIEISLQYLHDPDHILIRYEDLVDCPKTVLTKLCDFIGINFSENMLVDYSLFSQQFSLEKVGRTVKTERIETANDRKFNKLFDERQKNYIWQRLSRVNLDNLTILDSQ